MKLKIVKIYCSSSARKGVDSVSEIRVTRKMSRLIDARGAKCQSKCQVNREFEHPPAQSASIPLTQVKVLNCPSAIRFRCHPFMRPISRFHQHIRNGTTHFRVQKEETNTYLGILR